MIGPGFSYLWKDKSGAHHLWFVLSSPVLNPEFVVTVNVSTYRPRKDQSCILNPGDHEFIVTQSCVMYDEAECRTLEELEEMVASNVLFLKLRRRENSSISCWMGHTPPGGCRQNSRLFSQIRS
jgi:hypothetical protein